MRNLETGNTEKQSVILSSTDPDAIAVSILLARNQDLPPKRLYFTSFALTEGLAHPVCLALKEGSLFLTGFFPSEKSLESLKTYLDERPEVVLRVWDNHYWPQGAEQMFAGHFGPGSWNISTKAWWLTTLLRDANGGDVTSGFLCGLADSVLPSDEHRPLADVWRDILLALWSESSWVELATRPLLDGDLKEWSEEAMSMGKAYASFLDELMNSPFHLFPLVEGQGVLIMQPRNAVAPMREFSARLRKQHQAQISLSCFDDTKTAFLEYGYQPLGQPIPSGMYPDPSAVSEALQEILPEQIRCRPISRGTILLETTQDTFTKRAGEVIQGISSCRLLDFS